MKTLLSLIFLFVSVMSWATVRTVSNDPTRPAQFNGTGNTGFVNAQNASIAGDTLYIYGSPFSYGNLEIRKRLVVIGAGYAPNNQFGQPTRTGQVSLFRDGSTDPSGTVITGLLIESSLNCTGTLVANNITLFRNRITNTIFTYLNNTQLSSGWIIYNNIFVQLFGGASGSTTNSTTNLLVANNIVTGSIASLNTNTAVIDHNIFLSSANIGSLWNVIVSNNIFVRSSGTVFSGAVVFCTFNNNLSNQNTIGAASSYSPTDIFEATFTGSGGGSNSGGGNKVGAASLPIFVTDPNPDNYVTSDNYRLQPTSPGKNYATDGTDVGIYGGSFPFPTGGEGTQYDTSPMPPIPQVIAVNIQNATIQPNGTLNVQVQGRVNN